MKHLSLPLFLLASLTLARAQTTPIADAINHLGLDLYRQQVSAHTGTAPAANLLLSPYSIQTALAMTYAGADGATRTEMQRVLHFSNDDVVPAQFERLRTDLAAAAKNGVELNVANRLYAQRGYAFRSDFLSLLRTRYAAPLEEMNFAEAQKSAATINQWVEQQTHDKIRDLISPDALSANTRLVLVNALYFRSPWSSPFGKYSTAPTPFHLSNGQSTDVPTMHDVAHFGYAKKSGFSLIALPYENGQFQFVIVLPAQDTSLEKIESQLTPALLAECAKLPAQSLSLYLPKFKIAGPSVNLRSSLISLGMKTAFDDPRTSANFNRMAPRKPDDYLAISEVVHKTWLVLDEEGTEAAAATAVQMVALGVMVPASKPIEIRVDRPFFFVLQHVASGACLFIGRVTDPRAQ